MRGSGPSRRSPGRNAVATAAGIARRAPSGLVLLVAGSFVLRAALAVGMDLIHEEAYYWNYGEHLALGYLDHPPMIGWLIRLATDAFGTREWAVRLPALVAHGVAAWFLFRLTRNLYDRAAARRAVLLYAVLPAFFVAGLLATPDAPLYAGWAAALFFLERALIGDRPAAWLGAGAAIGFGLLSKYTIALLGPATLLFLLADRPSRRRLLTPGPWLGALVAAALFSPVIVWNARHGWASFVYQGPRRWAEGGGFSLHLLVGAVLVLITPTGLWAAIAALREEGDARRRRFAAIFTLAPLAVLVAFSLFRTPKLNWAGPVWLAAVPGMAAGMAAGRFRRAWSVTLPVTLVLLGGALFFVVLGLPGVGEVDEIKVPAAWREFGAVVDEVAANVERETGEPPLRTGVDIDVVSNVLSFYTADRDARRTTGRHLFGKESRMWSTWSPADAAVGRDVIVVAQRAKDLPNWLLRPHFERVSEVHDRPVVKHGRVVTRVFWRVGYGYRR